jgi:hypothetical protein
MMDVIKKTRRVGQTSQSPLKIGLLLAACTQQIRYTVLFLKVYNIQKAGLE